MKVFVQGGEVRFVYSDETMKALEPLGVATIRRASHVEPSVQEEPGGPCWWADMAPVGRGSWPFRTRASALRWEVQLLEEMGAPLPKEAR